MLTQSMPQLSDFQKKKQTKNILNVSNSYEIKWCSLPRSGSWGHHTETKALCDELKDNCKQDNNSAAN